MWVFAPINSNSKLIHPETWNTHHTKFPPGHATPNNAPSRRTAITSRLKGPALS